MAILPIETDRSLEDIVPIVPAETFDQASSARFWVGRVAGMGAVLNPTLFRATGILRGNVYVGQFDFLPPESLDADGVESDELDPTSVHWAVVENVTGDVEDHDRVPGCMRLIMGGQEAPLPIEHHFPELFPERLGPDAVEVSRFIARHEDQVYTQHAIALSLIRAVVMYAGEHEINDFYCLIEEPLKKRLRNIGLPLEELGASRIVPELGGDLHPIRINRDEIKRVAFGDNDTLLRGFFEGAEDNLGEAFYSHDLVEEVRSI